MAPLRGKPTAPVGSEAWITAERENALQFEDQDVEDFTYAARNEVEWLNEHMADIFSRNQIEVTEIFKTPGKLRGKTPRTARKRNPLETRAPLTDVFAPNPQAFPDSSRSPQQKQTAAFTIAQDKPPKPANVVKAASREDTRDKENDDPRPIQPGTNEMEIDSVACEPVVSQNETLPVHHVAPDRTESLQSKAALGQSQNIEENIASKEANNIITAHPPSFERICAQPTSKTRPSPNDSVDSAYASQDTQMASFTASAEISKPAAVATKNGPEVHQNDDGDDDRSQSEGSSPERPLIRKSSLNFAALPARDPLPTKKSLGTRPSRTSQLEQVRTTTQSRISQLGRSNDEGHAAYKLQAGVAESTQTLEVDLMAQDVDMTNAQQSEAEAASSTLYSKTSTQRLHDKISMLAQSQPRPTKSLVSLAAQQSQPLYPDISHLDKAGGTEDENMPDPKFPSYPALQQDEEMDEDGDEDNWTVHRPEPIAPNDRPAMVKSHSADVMEQIQGKNSIGELEKQSSIAPQLNKPLPQSPLREAILPGQKSQYGHYKSASASVIPSPTKSGFPNTAFSQTASASNPNLSIATAALAAESYTPMGSPTSKKFNDGPISASKAKLSSILKSARGIFASSAGVSAQAKLETLSPRTMRVREVSNKPSISTLFSPSRENVNGGDIFSRINTSIKDSSRVTSASSSSPSKDKGRRTRSSTEREEKRREKEAKEKQKVEEDLNKARVREAQKASAFRAEKERVASQEKQYSEMKEQQQKPMKMSMAEQPIRKSPRKLNANANQNEGSKNREADTQMTDAPPSDAELVDSHRPMAPQAKPREPRRPMRPIKEIASKNKPAPVSIRVGTASQWDAALSSNVQDNNPPESVRPESAASRATSVTTSSQSSNNTFKNSVTATGSKPKALVMAARKKELEEREAHRKAELKREMDKKRAAQQEQDRREEMAQRREAERQQREKAAQEEKKRIVAKAAADRKKVEAAKKMEANRNQAAQRTKPTTVNLTSEKAHPTQLGENSASRAPSRMNGAPPGSTSSNTMGARALDKGQPRGVQEHLQPGRGINQPPINPARPPKRALHADAGDDGHGRSVSKAGPGYLQADGKRRRTNEDQVETYEPRPPMAPPIRQSNVRTKEANAKNLFPHGYASVQSSTQSHQTGMPVKPPSLAQVPLQAAKPGHPLDMAKFSTAKIPFGDGSANPMAVGGMHKTPVRPATATSKSSPRYQNGDSIELPEIATDSEDDDDEEFAVPDWAANSPIITDQLMRQDALNPEEVFGPIAPLHMEEIFRNKERHHRFRQRTSSANWSGQDRLTQDEIAEDMRAREHLRINGHWTYGLLKEGRDGRQ